MSSIFTGTKHLVGQNECLDWLKIIRFNCSTIQINYRKIDYFKHRCAVLLVRDRLKLKLITNASDELVLTAI